MTFRDHRIKGHIIVKLSHVYFIVLGSYVRKLHIRILLELILATHLMTFRDHSYRMRILSYWGLVFVTRILHRILVRTGA